MKLLAKSRWLSSIYSIVSLSAILLCGVSSAPAQQGLTLVSHYTCAANSGLYQADSSGNNNNLNGGGSWTPNATWGWTSNAIAGGGALVLDGGENISFYGPPPGDQPFDSWLATFYGSFSISLWVNTTNVLGNDSDTLNCCNDAQIIYAYSYYNPGVDDTIPIALTGHKVAFFTGDPTGNNGDTLHSTNTVTTGQWVQIVVTRDGTTGQKSIYVNGTLDSSDYGVTNNLDGDIGYDDIGGGPGYSYAGGLDDMQFYSGVLSASQVAFLYANPGMTVTNVPSPTGLLAFYDFDEGTDFAADLSANGFNLVNGGNFGGPVLSTDSISGSGAVYFNGGSFLTPPTNLLTTIAGNFSLSVWIKTTQSTAWDRAPAFYGAGIVSADLPGATNDLIPMALTGGTIGFNTGSSNNDDTVNGLTDINDGNYHHIVVTRNETNGQKQIYIDGAFSASDTTNAGLLNAPQLITIGALADASQTDPTSPEYTGYNGFVGLMDDMQFYSRILTAGEIQALYTNPGSNVTNSLVCHYDFDEGTVLAADVSGNGNNMVFAGAFNGPGPAIASGAESGIGAVDFDGTSFLVPDNDFVTNLAGSFSLSVWLQTTQSLGNPGDPADNGAGVVTAEVSDQSYDLIPLALTGGYVAFETDGDSTDLLDSATAINDGAYHHVVVTRDGGSGTKQIYIDGTLSTSDVSDSALLNNPQILVLGCLADASQSDPNSPTQNGANGYAGLMDQLQFYDRVISSSEVTFLYDNPGATLLPGYSPPPPPSLGVALDATNLPWSTSGDAAWFGETTNTYSTNAAAAQSGSLLDGQSSLLQTTITGPGTISFYWQTMAAGGDDFVLEFDVDGNDQGSINGQTPWVQVTYTIADANPHTLTWNANTLADNGSSPTDAGFLDQVVFTAANPPVITLNPFNQTNYPGYEVALLAGASNALPPTLWKWYKVGNPNPIPQATNALYIPNSSGTSSVAGDYYAVASNLAGSQDTTTAMVTFVSSPLPPTWSTSFVSPLVDFDTNGEYYTTASNAYYACMGDSTGTNEYSVGYSAGSNYYNNSLQIASINGENAAIIVKQNLAADNPVQWVVAITNNGNGDAYGNGIALAPGGGIYVSGYYSGTNWLGARMLNDAGEGSYFLARFDAGGNLIWLTTVSNSFPFLNCITSDSSGNVTVTAIVNNSTTVGGTSFAVSGQTSFLAQFSSSGVLNWVDHTSNTILYLANGGGRVYASLPNWLDGNTNNSIGGIFNHTDRNWTIAALNTTNGQGIWLRGVGEAYGQNPPGTIDDTPTISVSATNVFLVGTAYGDSAVFGSFTVPITGGRGQYFARYDTNGNAQLATAFGSATTQPWSAVANSAGDVYVTGGFDTYSFFGNDLLAGPRISTLGSGYYGQSFLAKFDYTGTPQWALQAIASGGREAAADFITLYSVSLGGNNIWVAGVGIGPVFFDPDLPTSNGYFDSDTDEEVALGSGFLGMVTDNEQFAPVTLLNPAMVGADFQFSFVSTTGHTNYVQYSTNLANGTWLPYSTIVGDGTTKTVNVPTNPVAEFFRVDTQ